MIRLLSDQLMTKKQMGIDVFFRGIKEGIKKKYSKIFIIFI